MNKLEKILAQSVTPEMVAEQLTEQEIEEVIEEYELKVEEAEQSIERAEHKEKESLEMVERYQRSADDWKEVVEEEKEKLKTWRSVVKKAEKALERTKDNPSDDCLEINEGGHVWYHKNTGNPLYTNSNKCRAKLIKEAKEYIQENKYGLEAEVNRKDRMVIVHDYGIINKIYIYPPHLTWNKHIVKAWGMAKFNADNDMTLKFGMAAQQPTDIVKDMDVLLYFEFGTIKDFFAIGSVSRYDKTSDELVFSKVYEKGSGVDIEEGECIYDIASNGFKILSDTKVNYKEDKNE